MPQHHGAALTARARARKQQLPRKKKKVIKLTPQARKELTAEQNAKRDAFDKDVAEIWRYCQKACADLGVKHHKPLRKCLDAVYLGARIQRRQSKTSAWRAYLAATVKQINGARQPGEARVNALTVSKTHGDKYRETPAATIQQYIEDLEESRAEKTMGRRVTGGSKVNDICNTFADVTKALTRLDARVGIRSVVLIVRSNSEYNQAPLSFFTDEATAAFLPKVYGIDVQDMLTRMEGYSVAGGTIAGMAVTYKARVHAAKSELSVKLRQALSLITGDPKIKMQYKTFFRDITVKHSVTLRHWPHKKLQAPGAMGHSLPAITKLLDLVTSGEVFFEVVDEDELQRMITEQDEMIATGEVEVTSRKPRKDIGQSKKRQRQDDSDESGSDSNQPPSKKAKTSVAVAKAVASNYKSAPLVVDSDID